PSPSVGNPASFQVASRLPPREGPSTVINRQASVDRVVVDIGLTGLTTGGVVGPIARHSDLGRSRIRRRNPRVQICATPGRRNLAEGEAAARTCSGLCPAVRRRTVSRPAVSRPAVSRPAVRRPTVTGEKPQWHPRDGQWPRRFVLGLLPPQVTSLR